MYDCRLNFCRGKFANGAAYAAFAAAVQSLAQDDVVVTGGKNLSNKELAELRKNAATPEFYDKNGKPLSEHLSLDEALQSGEDASRAAASGTKNEYGVATIKGGVTAGEVQTYYNSAPVTSNSPLGIAWNTAGLKGSLVALNHLHPGNNLGFSPEDRKAYKTYINRGYSELRGIYMFDGRGNHWYGPKSPGFFGKRTHSCGGASATTWTCPSF